jgi:hypothetical protein
MPEFTHNGLTYEIAVCTGQVGDLVDAAGQPVVLYYSRVRVKPPADKEEDNKGWVLVTEGNQTAVSRNSDRAMLQAQEYIQNNPA